MPDVRTMRFSYSHYKAKDARRNWCNAHVGCPVSGISPSLTIMCPTVKIVDNELTGGRKKIYLIAGP